LHSISTSISGRLAIKHHPDKNPDDPHAEDRFKEIAIAYQTLSDPTLRKKYNEFGPKESAPEGGYVDPEEVFGAIFGGDRFTPIIGQISLARDMKAALQEAEEAEGEEAGGKKIERDAKGRPILSEEEKAKKEEKARKVAEEVSIVLFAWSWFNILTGTESGCSRGENKETR
jgi:DnaJ-class molecular chaperone